MGNVSDSWTTGAGPRPRARSQSTASMGAQHQQVGRVRRLTCCADESEPPGPSALLLQPPHPGDAHGSSGVQERTAQTCQPIHVVVDVVLQENDDVRGPHR